MLIIYFQFFGSILFARREELYWHKVRVSFIAFLDLTPDHGQMRITGTKEGKDSHLHTYYIIFWNFTINQTYLHELNFSWEQKLLALLIITDDSCLMELELQSQAPKFIHLLTECGLSVELDMNRMSIMIFASQFHVHSPCYKSASRCPFNEEKALLHDFENFAKIRLQL